MYLSRRPAATVVRAGRRLPYTAPQEERVAGFLVGVERDIELHLK